MNLSELADGKPALMFQPQVIYMVVVLPEGPRSSRTCTRSGRLHGYREDYDKDILLFASVK